MRLLRRNLVAVKLTLFRRCRCNIAFSYINCFPKWTPAVEKNLPFSEPLNSVDGWVVADLMRAAGMPATAARWIYL